VQTFAFRAQSDGAVHLIVQGVVGLRAVLVEADDPKIFGFQILQGPGNIRHFRNGEVLTRSGGDFRHSSSHARGTAFGNDDSIHAGRVCRAKNCAQVMRVFYAVEYHNQRVWAALGGEHIIEIAVLLGRGDRNHSLMCIVPRHAIEFGARHKAYGNAVPAGFIDDALQAEVVAVLCHSNPFKGATARLKGLSDGIDAVNKMHVKPV
jgi:hypothetical protein